MYNYKYSIKENIKRDHIWDLYSDVKKWTLWDSSMQNVELNGNFSNGTSGTMFIKNMPPLSFELVDVVENESFTVFSTLGDVKVYMRHFIEEENEQIKITHSIDIEGSNEEQIKGIGLGMSKSIPDSIKKLVELLNEF